MLGLDWEQTPRRNIEDLLKKGDRTMDQTLVLASGQFTGGEPLLHKSDWMLKQFFPYVRLDDVPAFGPAKKI